MTATVAIPQRTAAHVGAVRRPLRVPAAADVATFRRRRRAASVALVAALSALGLGAQAVLTDSDSVPASAVGVGTATAHRLVTAQPGDSLWSIAEEHHGAVPLRDYVAALVELNGGVSAIDAGQAVALP